MQTRIRKVIGEVEGATALHDISNLTKLQGQGRYYRIRIGDYRIGLVLENDSLIFVRCLNRREVYKYFP